MSYPSAPGSLRITQSLPRLDCKGCSFARPGSSACNDFHSSMIAAGQTWCCAGREDGRESVIWKLIQGPRNAKDLG